MRRFTSATESKYSHHNAPASTIAATSAVQPPAVSTCCAAPDWPASTSTSPSRMIRKSPKRSAKWCASSASAGSAGASSLQSCLSRARRVAWRSSFSIAPDSSAIPITHRTYGNGSGTHAETRNKAAE